MSAATGSLSNFGVSVPAAMAAPKTEPLDAAAVLKADPRIGRILRGYEQFERKSRLAARVMERVAKDSGEVLGRASDARTSGLLIPLAWWLAHAGLGCSEAGVSTSAKQHDATAPFADASSPKGSFCSLPGSVVYTSQGAVVMPGVETEASTPDLSQWLHLPVGFCAHYFATVKTARQLRFAPGGELFVASSRTSTTGGANDGVSNIVVLPDDDHDGYADSNNILFEPQLTLPSVQGLMFTGGYFYYQNDAKIMRVAYKAGDRQSSRPEELVTDMSNWPQAREHWPKVFDVGQDGTIYITNGGSQSDHCLSSWPVRGGVFKLNPDGTTTLVATGLRNPIAIRCERDHDVCLVCELALDYSYAPDFGREKLVPVREGDNWGYPCCATQGTPYMSVKYMDTGEAPDCSNVPVESDAFYLSHTPFGVDFEPGRWPAPWTHRVFVTVHGVVGSWIGARVVGIAMDTTTGLPLWASELDGGGDDNMLDFATGWDDGTLQHGRPAPIAFAPDGRMFLGDDQRGAVIWIAPSNLMIP
jgi:glucose/arabinose dehydrogenase